MAVPLSVQLYGVGVGSASSASFSSSPFVTTRAPNSSDVLGPFGVWKIGQEWVDRVANTVYILTSMTTAGGSLTATWTSSVSSGVTALTGNSGGAIAPVAGNINIVGAAGTTVVGAGSTLTITATPQSFTWNDDPASGALVVDNGYIIKTGAKSFSLPATSVVGEEIALMLTGGTSWTITQGAGQFIRVAAATSTIGAGGSVATTGAGQTIWMICTTANTGWEALSFVGALNVV